MINDEKEKEILSLLEAKKDSKLYLEVTGYISRLDGYIYKLQKQLQQRDFIIKEAIEKVENMESHFIQEEHTGTARDDDCELEYLRNILNKYKGDSNEKEKV